MLPEISAESKNFGTGALKEAISFKFISVLPLTLTLSHSEPKLTAAKASPFHLRVLVQVPFHRSPDPGEEKKKNEKDAKERKKEKVLKCRSISC